MEFLKNRLCLIPHSLQSPFLVREGGHIKGVRRPLLELRQLMEDEYKKHTLWHNRDGHDTQLRYCQCGRKSTTSNFNPWAS